MPFGNSWLLTCLTLRYFTNYMKEDTACSLLLLTAAVQDADISRRYTVPQF
jgi:hypothetical protein